MKLASLVLLARLASGAFTDINAGLTAVEYCDITWGDYDDDGDLDLASAGWIKSWPCVANICRNEGGGVFVESNSGLERCMACSLPWGDYDGDGDLDLAVAGYGYDGSNAWGMGDVFRNDGGNFSGIGAPLVPMRSTCSLAWGDYDNDGDLDLALAGTADDPYPPVSRIYRNDGGGTFVDVNAALIDVKECSLAWADYDNDGDLDLALAGDTGSGYLTTIYGNNGDGTFTDIFAELPGVTYASVAWGDYDNDGDFDLALTGYDGTSPLSKVFCNDGGGTFTDINAALTAVRSSHHGLAWGDYDNDGDLDLAILGNDGSTWLSKLYRNDGGGTFTEIAAGLADCYVGTMAWGDYDNDGDLDLIVGGKTTFNPFNPVTRLYRNDSPVSNTLPVAPMGLSASVSGNDVTFSWNPSTDAETPQLGLSYNLRVGTASKLDDVMSGAANTATGWRKIPATGNAQKMLSWIIKGLPDDTYYWSVQAVDTAFAGSPWAVEQTVTVGGGPVLWHVSDGGSGGFSGVDWANAMAHPQDAMDAAAPGDEIWVAGGTYYRRGGADTVLLTMKNWVNIYGGFAGTETARDQRNPVENVTVLDGGDVCYHVVVGASNATLDGFTITRGNANGGVLAENRGGGMYNDGVAGLTVANCTFLGNRTDFGGAGMHNSSSSPTVADCTFSGNTAGGDGGGMENSSGSSPTISGCTFDGNSAVNNGGAVCSSGGFPVVEDCLFNGNTAGFWGGGTYNNMSSATVRNCTFAGHWATGGGGIFNKGSGVGPTIVTNCVFLANDAATGAGMSNLDTITVAVANSTFSWNTATTEGGAVYNSNSSPALTNCVLWGDWAPSCPEIHDDGSSVSSVTCSCVMGGYTGTGNINADPLFVDVPASDLRLRPGSPCIDAADATAPGYSPTDMDGNGRHDDPGKLDIGVGDPCPDMGAFEFQETTPTPWVWYVDQDASGMMDGTSWSDACRNVWQAMNAARAGEEVWVAEGTYTPTDEGDRTASFQLVSGVGLYGGFAGTPGTEGDFSSRDWKAYVTILSGDIGTGGDISDNSYHVVMGASDATLDGFTVSSGRADGGGIDNRGAGMCNDSVDGLVVGNCTFSGNSVSNFGAGMYNEGSSPVVVDCTFSANSGGGMFNISGSSPAVTGCVFSDNSGAGLCNGYSSSPVVTGCVFSGNTAASSGGGMYNYSESSPTVSNCTFEWNDAGAHGGGMYNDASSPQVENCRFEYNRALGNDGGGIANSAAADPSVRNCVFYANSAGMDGGAVANMDGAKASVTNCTFYFNVASQWGGGLSAVGVSTATVRNSIFWANSALSAGSQIWDAFGTMQVTYSDVQGGYEGMGNVDSDPLFVNAAGGYFGLSECSPCIDSADGSAAPTFDVDGNARYDDLGMPNVGAGSPNYADMGAYEYQGDSPAIAVTAPDAGWDFTIDADEWITWLTTGTVDQVDIVISRDGGTSWGPTPITTWEDNDGQYLWTVTGPASTNCIVRVCNSQGSGLPIGDSGVFTISGGNVAPSVTVTWPTDGATVSGTLTIQADATDPDDGVERVEFYIDGSLDWTDYTPTYEHGWDTTSLSDGDHEISAVAYDHQGATAEHKITVNVQNGSNEPPGVNIASPSTGATVSGMVLVKANAWDDDGTVDRVEFDVDWSWQMTDDTSPYEFNWDSTTVSDGWHAITARAYDDDGAWSDHSINVNVQNGDMTPPGPVTGLQVTNRAETTLLLEWKNPNDADFQGVVIFRNEAGSPTYAPSRGEGFAADSTYGSDLCVYVGAGREFMDAGVAVSSGYYYAVYACDEWPNYSPAAYVDDWTTGNVAPWVEWTDPWNDQMNVALNGHVRIRFSEPMDGWSTRNAFSIGPHVDGSFRWEDHGRTLVFEPKGDFEPDTWYEVRVSSAAQDLVANQMGFDDVFRFETQLGAGILGGGCGSAGAASALLVALALALRRKRS